MKNMVYIQSGGPTSVINSSLYGAFKEACLHPDEIDHIYGSLNGVEGLIEGRLFDLKDEDEKEIELLKQTPGAALGTTRRKLPNDINDPVYGLILENIKKFEIKYVFVNGGNDSMDTCNLLSQLCEKLKLDVCVIGVPKTIDNDLACTDHTLGYGSAAKAVINEIYALSKDALCFKKGKVHIVEVMGRNAGWLTAAADLVPEDGHPDLIYLPENEFDVDDFVEKVKAVADKHNGSGIVVVSEGVRFEREESAEVDAFGHKQLSGTGAALAKILLNRAGIQSRVVELSLTQRANPFLISKNDRDEAIKIGELSVKAALRGETAKMTIVKRVSNEPLKLEYEMAPVSLVANAERKIPQEMMYDDTRMSDSFREYVRPLIQGDIAPICKDGIVQLTTFKKKLVK